MSPAARRTGASPEPRRGRPAERASTGGRGGGERVRADRGADAHDDRSRDDRGPRVRDDRARDGRRLDERARDDRAGHDRPAHDRPAHDRPARDRRARIVDRPTPAVTARRRRRARTTATLTVSLLLVAGLVQAVWFSSLLGAREVSVVGTTLLSVDDVRQAAAVPVGTPLLRVDTTVIADRVRGLAAVADVTVARAWPSTVEVRVTERTPVAWATVSDGVRLVDATGIDYATVPGPPPAGLPELSSRSGDATVAATEVITALSGPGREAVRGVLVAVRATSPYDVELTLTDDRTVRWGGAAESERKAAVLAALLTQPGEVYDVATPELPTIK